MDLDVIDLKMASNQMVRILFLGATFHPCHRMGKLPRRHPFLVSCACPRRHLPPVLLNEHPAVQWNSKYRNQTLQDETGESAFERLDAFERFDALDIQW